MCNKKKNQNLNNKKISSGNYFVNLVASEVTFEKIFFE